MVATVVLPAVVFSQISYALFAQREIIIVRGKEKAYPDQERRAASRFREPVLLAGEQHRLTEVKLRGSAAGHRMLSTL